MIYRVKKDKNYTIVDNKYLFNKSLSLGAIGLFTIILSFRDKQKFSVELLSNLTGNSKKIITKYLNELKENHYIKVKKHNSSNGFYYEYSIFESNGLTLEVFTGSPDTQIGCWDQVPKQATGPTLLSNINTNTIYDKIDKTKLALNHLTEFLVKKGLISVEDTSLFDYNNFILELLSKEDYELVVKSIKYTTNYMLKHDFKDENYLPINNKFGYFKTSVINNIEKLKLSDVPLYDDNFFD